MGGRESGFDDALSVPACWSWDVPSAQSKAELIAARMREQESLPPAQRYSASELELVFWSPQMTRFGTFHDERCAVCGVRGQHLVDDHCHQTGQVRGYLCRSCNVREGKSGAAVFIRYRRIHPAAILDYHELYTGVGWNDGWSLVEMRRDAYQLGPRPETPWPVWDRDAPLDAGRG